MDTNRYRAFSLALFGELLDYWVKLQPKGFDKRFNTSWSQHLFISLSPEKRTYPRRLVAIFMWLYVLSMHTSSASLGVYLVPSLPPLISRSECSSLGTIFFQHGANGARCVKKRRILQGSVDHGEPQGQTAASFRRCTGMVIFILFYFFISCSHVSYSNTVYGSVPGSFGFWFPYSVIHTTLQMELLDDLDLFVFPIETVNVSHGSNPDGGECSLK